MTGTCTCGSTSLGAGGELWLDLVPPSSVTPFPRLTWRLYSLRMDPSSSCSSQRAVKANRGLPPAPSHEVKGGAGVVGLRRCPPTPSPGRRARLLSALTLRKLRAAARWLSRCFANSSCGRARRSGRGSRGGRASHACVRAGTWPHLLSLHGLYRRPCLHPAAQLTLVMTRSCRGLNTASPSLAAPAPAPCEALRPSMSLSLGCKLTSSLPGPSSLRAWHLLALARAWGDGVGQDRVVLRVARSRVNTARLSERLHQNSSIGCTTTT